MYKCRRYTGGLTINLIVIKRSFLGTPFGQKGPPGTPYGAAAELGINLPAMTINPASYGISNFKGQIFYLRISKDKSSISKFVPFLSEELCFLIYSPP
jgi:hypothetical protein